MARDAFVRLGEDLVPLAESQRIGGTGLHAGRYGHVLAVSLLFIRRERLSVALRRYRLAGTIGTVGALVDLGRQGVPFRSRNAPGTGPYAVAAADALVGIVRHGSVRLTLQGRSRARRYACRLQAVQTAPHGEQIVQPAGSSVVREFVIRD